LNPSKVCENALKQAIEQLRPIYGKKETKKGKGAGGGI